ncbi:TetR/AcrR family transcriptional regulator [Shewanella maritima]|uniref:TetR/AcrR family transcriptional regulator n=1 Tax=Shewanella maritima TaxID=2520507 RepID=UPI003736CC69
MTTEEKLLDAAQTLIKNQGLINFSMADIPRACGLSRASCYQHFRDKNEVLAALCTNELLANIKAVKSEQYHQVSGVFSMVLRPLIYNHLKDRDQLAIDHAFEEFLSCLDALPDDPNFSFMKQGFNTLKNERNQGKMNIV